MKKYLIAPLVIITLMLTFTAQAATQSLEQLLSGIKADIAAKRLSSPAGNNALEKIEQYRQQAPFDFRITPVVYEWGSAYVALAKDAVAQKQYAKAQGYLDIVWPVAALTPGLEDTQAAIDKAGGAQAQTAKPAGPSAAEIERQRQVAAAAAAEKARIEADRKKQLAEQKRQEEQAKKAQAEEQARRQEQERARRLAAEKQQQQQAKAATTPAPAAVAPVVQPAVTTAPALVVSSNEVKQLWASAEEDTAPIASYPLDAEALSSRDRVAMEKQLAPICKAIAENEASVVVHSKNKADYRWLTVRLTICLRHEDSSFRLRYSHKDDAKDGEPFITLHPSRDTSLIKQAN